MRKQETIKPRYPHLDKFMKERGYKYRVIKSKPKLNEIEKIVFYFGCNPMNMPVMRRKLRALVRKAYQMGYEVGDDSMPFGATPQDFEQIFGVRP